MTLYAYDGASPFSLSAAKTAGAVLITGYIVGHPGGYDPITKDRVNAIRAEGMGFLPNWEQGPSHLVTCGKSGGVAAGQQAVAALQALGVPSDGTVAVAFSWDTYIQPTQYAQCAQVADGIIQGLAGKYLFSAYSQGGLLKYLSETGRLKVKGWLSASTGYPGYDPTASYVGMVQQTTTDVSGTDRNHIITDPHNIGAWWPDGSPYGDILTLPAAQAQQLADADRFATAACARVQALQGVVALQNTALTTVLNALTALKADVDQLKASTSSASGTYDATLTIGPKQ